MLIRSAAYWRWCISVSAAIPHLRLGVEPSFVASKIHLSFLLLAKSVTWLLISVSVSIVLGFESRRLKNVMLFIKLPFITSKSNECKPLLGLQEGELYEIC